MLNKLAIIIVGKPNAGKTTTLKHFHDSYYYKKPKYLRQVLRRDFSPFNYTFIGLKIIAFFLPSSRTETEKSLKETFVKINLGWYPDFIFMAEQLDGDEYDNTIKYLRQKEYHIKEFVITDTNPDSTWRFYDKIDCKNIQLHRTEQIADYVRNFIKSRI